MLSIIARTSRIPHHPLVGLPLERHHQVRQFGHRHPAPGDEFRLVPAGRIGDVDFAVVAGEAQRVPFLLLAAIFAAPGLRRRCRAGCRRPASRRSRRASRPSGYWSLRTARAARPCRDPRSRRCRLAASARHGSRRCVRGRSMRRPMNTRPCAVEHHDAGAGTIGQGFEGGHVSSVIGPRDGAQAIADLCIN